jgi:hypothetical protein
VLPAFLHTAEQRLADQVVVLAWELAMGESKHVHDLGEKVARQVVLGDGCHASSPSHPDFGQRVLLGRAGM